MYLFKLMLKSITFFLNGENYFEHYRAFFVAILENFNQFFGEQFVQQLLRVYTIRQIVNAGRCIYFVEIRENLLIHENHTADVASKTIAHNLKMLQNFKVLSLPRVDKLIKPFSSIELLSSDSSVLAIGPRSEDDLLCLVGYGFRADKIRGIDLISYSPWVDLGDMHAMPYEDNSWDAVVVCGVLNYSKTPSKAAQEIIRVAKNGAIIAIGEECDTITNEQVKQVLGYSIDGSRISSVAEILNFFGSAVDSIYFSHDIVAKQKDKMRDMMVIFSLKK